MADALTLFTTRMRQLILALEEQKAENALLREKLRERGEVVKALERALEQAKRDYNNMITAKMLTLTDGDVEGAKRRLTNVIRSINHCITMINAVED